MELRHLEYFMTMCQELHFTRASEKLGISQPTLSQQIRALELESDTLLFDRVGKKVIVTEAGKILYRHCVRMFDELGQAQTAIRELKGLRRGEIRIGSSGNHMLINSIISFHQSYPGIQINVAEPARFGRRIFARRGRAVGEHSAVYGKAVVGRALPSSFGRKRRGRACEVEANADGAAAAQIFGAANGRYRDQIERVPVRSRRGDDYARFAAGARHLSGVDPKRTRTIAIVDPTPQRVVGIVYRNDMFISSATKAFIDNLKQTF
ncbi:MAG: transcriptional regulator, LysR family [Paenibacillus sp.]|nr:transcriptional regulator, LysR family [Paenibacillus sp.]